jgi:PIN domain nuclease of toxin-antitoxin system
MRLLLDTQVFLWYISADARLPATCRDAVRDPANQVYLSVVSVWEFVIKHALGKFTMPEAPAEYLPRQRAAHQIADLLLDEGALIHLAKLPSLHRDPFDRVLVAQTLQHNLSLVTVDEAVPAYPVPLLPIM